MAQGAAGAEGKPDEAEPKANGKADAKADGKADGKADAKAEPAAKATDLEARARSSSSRPGRPT